LKNKIDSKVLASTVRLKSYRRGNCLQIYNTIINFSY